MKKLISLLLVFCVIFSLASCGEYNPPADDNADTNENENNGQTDNTVGSGGTEQRGEPSRVTVMLNGKVYNPPEVSDDSAAVKVRWTDGKNYHVAKLGADGSAECYGLDGEFAVSLLNLPDSYTYDPNLYRVNNDNRDVIIELLTITPAKGEGTDPYKCIRLSSPGNYRASMTYNGQEVFFEFEPTKAGIYRIESIMDVSAEMYDPVLDVYAGHSQYKIREKRIEGGGSSGSYTTNFSHTVQIDEQFIGNCYTFAIMLEGKDATYPTNVDFIITYEGDYHHNWIVSNIVYPEFIPNDDSYGTWYTEYLSYLIEDKARFGSTNFNIASVKIDGKNVFDQQYFKLNPDDGYYHVYNEILYAEYGGWGPILYANISVATNFIDSAFTEIEYAGNKALTVSNGTENYKLFIEGYSKLNSSEVSYFCIQGCKCLETNGGCCTIESRCTKCTDDCRHIYAKYIGQRGYADIAIQGRVPVTEELKDFLQKYSVNQKLFSDGNGWAEQSNPRYDAYEDSQWLFACGYYTR